jgi:hypothetical protein
VKEVTGSEGTKTGQREQLNYNAAAKGAGAEMAFKIVLN